MERWFSKGLLSWYKANKRALPWRDTKDPYKIWLSEVILQQTQVNQGLAYYQRFVAKYPQVQNLARAQEDEVLKLWQGLGYYSRARNLHMASKQICDNYKGIFPDSYQSIKALKGVGDYTAAAISSFAFNLPHAVVDGNVYRVLSRVFGIEQAIDSGKGKKEFQNLADELLDRKDPATYNQAIMEFGSQFCRPVNPDCEQCIFSSRCIAFANKSVASLPYKSKKTKVRPRFFNYVVLCDKQQNLVVNRRQGKDIWQGLYEFPLIETDAAREPEEFFKSAAFKNTVQAPFEILHRSGTYQHTLSHQQLSARFYVLKTKSTLKQGKETVQLDQLQELAFPRLIEKFLQDCDLKEIL